MTARALDRIAVVGGGAWGTALALTASRAGRETRLWVREPEVVDAIRRDGENATFLPGHAIPEAIAVDSDLGAVLDAADAALLVVPSQFLRAVCRAMAPGLAPDTALVICTKGIESETGKLPADIVAQELPGHALAVLSGPSFAAEVAAGLPTAVTVASGDAGEPDSLAERLARALATPGFRPYVGDDPVGVEVGGAVKNVLAIACGVATGLGYGANTRAALITRGLAEIKRLAEALGGRRETVSGLSGVGDLTLTCSSEQSRNMAFGKGLGEGRTPAELLANRASVVEGAVNAVSVTDLARRLGVEMPLCEAVRAIVQDGAAIDDVAAALLDRPLAREPGPKGERV